MRDVTARVEKESKDFKGDSGQMRGRKIRWRLLLPDARARALDATAELSNSMANKRWLLPCIAL